MKNLRLLAMLPLLGAILGGAPQVLAQDKVKVELFVMSKCPFCWSLMQDLAPVVEKLRAWIDFKVGFVGEVRDGELTSMHGPEEVAGDLLEICVRARFPKTMPGFLKCVGTELQREFPTGWQRCAQQVGVDAAVVEGCALGQEGKELLRAAFQESKAREVRGTPTLLIDGQPYTGPRTGPRLLRTICKSFRQAPPPCSALPPVPVLRVTVLTDRRCQDCNPEQLVGALKNRLEDPEIRVLDYGDPEGRALFQEAGLRTLPAVVFDAAVEQSEDAAPLVRLLTKQGPYRVMPTRGRFDPTAEICDNGVDDTADGKVDCQDPTCLETLVCRPERAGTLQLFIMSQCPYAATAVEALDPVLRRLRSVAQPEIHFVVTDQGGELQSMHGAGELAEDRRMACAQKRWAKRAPAYLRCRMKELREAGPWEPCARQAGLDPLALQACADGKEGEQLLRQDSSLCRSLGIGASPTWLANNKNVFTGVEPEDILKKFCAFNTQIPACRIRAEAPWSPEAPAPEPP